MKKLTRWFKHNLSAPGAVRRRFSETALQRIEHAIAHSETQHSGEIRFAVEAALPWSYLKRNAPARERAHMLFSKLRVWDTEHNNGVLIYVELADRAIEIVADRGLAAHVAPAEWQAIYQRMREYFRLENYEAGVVAGIEHVSQKLAAHFPARPGLSNVNELPNAPTVL